MPRRPSSRPACGSQPSARRPCRPAPAACGSRCRPPTRTLTSTGCSMRCRFRRSRSIRRARHLPDLLVLGLPLRRRPLIGVARPRRVVAVVGTGTDIGKTWVSAHLLTRLRAAACPCPLASRPSPSTLTTIPLASMRRSWALPPGKHPNRVRAASLVRGGHGAADGGRGPGPALVHDQRSGGRVGLAWRATSAWWRRRADCAHRWRRTVTASPSVAPCRPTGPVGRRRRVGHDQLRPSDGGCPRFSRGPVIVVLNRFEPDSDLHVQNLDWLRDSRRVRRGDHAGQNWIGFSSSSSPKRAEGAGVARAEHGARPQGATGGGTRPAT